MNGVTAVLMLRFLDAVIALLLVEGIGLSVYRAATGRGMRPRETVAFLGAGLAMVIALRVTIAGGRAEWFAAAMAASLALHVWHVAQRWTRSTDDATAVSSSASRKPLAPGVRHG